MPVFSSRTILMGAMLSLAGLCVSAIQSPCVSQNSAETPKSIAYAPNGWDQSTREKFYFTSQGSELAPYDWFLALEQPTSETLFRADLGRYHFLPGMLSSQNPDRLPLGFTRDETTKTFNGLTISKWVGLTCAACHTGAIQYKQRPSDANSTLLIIDGAPSHGNYGAFMQDLAASVDATSKDSAKFDRFAHRVLATGYNDSSRDDLYAQMSTFATHFAQLAACSKTPVAWGPGRVDAFGVIFNSVCSLALDMPQNFHTPDAPVSFPFLWNVKYQDHIQWHGEVPNKVALRPLTSGFNAMGRNLGEVLGVFAHIDFNPSESFYNSSVPRLNLLALEHWVDKLTPPPWPNALGQPDLQAIARGKSLYKQQRCGSCHAAISGNPLQVVHIVPYPLNEVDTDPTATQNIHTQRVDTGRLYGHHITGLFSPTFKSTAPAADVVQRAVFGALFNIDFLNSDAVRANSAPLSSEEAARQIAGSATLNSTADLNKIGYEARPLHGIWATAPYLHNGSVSSLYELLLPPDQRQKRFYVGTFLFDPVKVGYSTDAGSGGELYDTGLRGNSNSGHVYGTTLTDVQRYDLIAYLKTL